MIERGDYIAPTFNYEPRFNKPVLSYWIVAGFYKLFGVSVAVQRIPIALGAFVLILTACVLAYAAASAGSQQPDRRGAALDARAVGGTRPRGGAASHDVRAPDLHRHLHLDVHGAHAALLRARGALSRAAAAVPAVDVRLGGARRADEGSRGGGPSRPGVRGVPARPSRAEARARDDDPGGASCSSSPSSCPGTPRCISATAGPTSRRSSAERTSRASPKGSASRAAAVRSFTCRSFSAIRSRGRCACSGRPACG